MATLKDAVIWYWDLDEATANVVDRHQSVSVPRVGTTTTGVGNGPGGRDCISVGNGAGKYRASNLLEPQNYTAGMAASIWGFRTATSSLADVLFVHRGNNTNAGQRQYWQIFAKSTDGVSTAASLMNDSTTNSVASTAKGLNEWVHYGLNVTGTHVEQYINGELTNSVVQTITTQNTLAASFSIGGASWRSIIDEITAFRGRIALAGVFNRSFSAAEWELLYNNGNGRDYDELNVSATTKRFHPLAAMGHPLSQSSTHPLSPASHPLGTR